MPKKDEDLREKIVEVMRENPGYGSPRVAIALGINKRRAARGMKKFDLRPARRSKKPRKPLDQGKEATGRPNIVKKLCPIVPNYVWVSDFTYIRFGSRFLYLCTVMDLFTGEVLGSNISNTHDAKLVRTSLERAILSQGGFPIWFHSDQGSEYASKEVQDWLERQGVLISMSPKSSPWWNGAQESFFGRFKLEFGDVERFETTADLVEALYGQLNYHNQKRIKSKLKMPPAAFQKQ